MRILIVEDNPLNAFCLSRLFETICDSVQINIVANSTAAIAQIEKNKPALVVIDGQLSANSFHNGPALADLIWKKYPSLALVAWTDCDEMQFDFASVFQRHNHKLNQYTNWSKTISPAQIQCALDYLTKEFDMESPQLPTINYYNDYYKLRA